MTYRVRVEKESLRFAAAHMATFGGDLERLHGHNYALTVEVEGSLTPDAWVIDFDDLKAVARDLCKRLDHRFLLQGASNLLEVGEADGVVSIAFGNRRYTFPGVDVVELPIDNTTAERLAEWFAGEIRRELANQGAGNVTSITIGVEETPGQSGWHTLAVT
jgi:6-pyruvoyltetrahydropterin/6-carboxytetrahydropterin synthase